MTIHNTRVSFGATANSSFVDTRTLSQKYFLKENVRVIGDDESKDGLYFCASEFNGSREKGNIVAVRLVVVDVDSASREDTLRFKAEIESDGLEYALHTTASHRKDKPRYRFIFKPSRDMLPHEYKHVVESFIDRYRIMGVDVPTSSAASQPMYMPTVRESYADDYRYVYKKGKPIHIDDLLGDYVPTEDAGEDTLEPLVPPRGVSEALFIATICKCYPAETLEYDDWAQFGMALWHQTDGSELGLKAWLDWSSRSSKHDDKITSSDMRTVKWPSFKGASAGQSVTLRTILNKKDVRGTTVLRNVYATLMNKASTKGSLDALVYDIQRERFLTQKEKSSLGKIYKNQHNAMDDDDSLGTAEARRILTHINSNEVTVDVPEELSFIYDQYACIGSKFKHLFSGREYHKDEFNMMYSKHLPLSGTNGTTRKYITEALSKGLYGLEPLRTITDMRFLPGVTDRLVQSEYGWTYNMFNYKYWPKAKPVDDITAKRVAVMIDKHINLLSSGRPEVADLMKCHLASLRQNPSRKINWGISLASIHQGVGKSMLISLYKAVLGERHINVIAPQALLENYDDPISPEGKLMTFIEEFSFPTYRSKSQAMEKLKGLMTSDGVISMRKIHVGNVEREASSSFYILSNDTDALGSDSYGRRWCAVDVGVYSDEQVEEYLNVDKHEFYGEYKRLMDTSPEAFIKYFEEYDINPSVFSVEAFKITTKEKEEMRSETSSSQLRSYVSELLESPEEYTLTNSFVFISDLVTSLEDSATENENYGLNRVNDIIIRRLLKKNVLPSLGYTKLGASNKQFKMLGRVMRASAVYVNKDTFKGMDVDETIAAMRSTYKNVQDISGEDEDF